MSRPSGDTAELVRRTLRAVAETLPVEDRELPDEAQPPLPPAEPGDDGDRRPGARPRRRRGPGRRPLVAAVAAAVVVVAGVWATRLADGDDVRTGDPSTSTSTVPAGEDPAAGWLPEGIAPAPSDRGDAIGTATPIEGALYTGPGEDDVVASAAVADGGIDAAQAVGEELGLFIGTGPDGIAVAQRSGSDAVAVSRDPSMAAPLAAAMSGNGVSPAQLAPDGWATAPLPLDWLPRTGVGRWTAYGDPDAGLTVELHAASATLPDPDALEALLQDEERITVHDQPAWAGSERDVAWVVWQDSSGVAATAIGVGVSVADLVRVAEESAMPSAVPPPGPEAGPDAAGNRVMEDESDWPLLCQARPGDPALPGEEAGVREVGVMGTRGSEDVLYELLVWEDRITAEGTERTGACWRLTITGEPPLRGGGDVVTHGVSPVPTLQPVWWTDEETEFFVAHRPGLTVVGADGADVVATPLDVQSADGTAFTFLRVARDGRSEVSFQVVDGSGQEVTTVGPVAMDDQRATGGG
jgi:hypothetical protein